MGVDKLEVCWNESATHLKNNAGYNTTFVSLTRRYKSLFNLTQAPILSILTYEQELIEVALSVYCQEGPSVDLQLLSS